LRFGGKRYPHLSEDMQFLFDIKV